MTDTELPELADGELVVRPVTEGEAVRLAEMTGLPGVREWWGPVHSPEDEVEGILNDGNAFAIEIGGELAGWVSFSEEDEPDYRYAALDIFLAHDRQDHGYGPRSLHLVCEWLIAQRSHRRLTIDPAATNDRAIAAYLSVGFRPVGLMRSYERGHDGTWHDNLLMDMLAAELRRPGEQPG